VKPGDRIAVALTNVPELGLVFTAAARIGAIMVPFNYMLKAEELTRSISDCGANVTIGAGNPIAEAEGIAAEIRARGVHCVVIDGVPAGGPGTPPPGRTSAARRIADAMGGAYYQVRNLTGGAILEKVQRSEPPGAGRTTG